MSIARGPEHRRVGREVEGFIGRRDSTGAAGAGEEVCGVFEKWPLDVGWSCWTVVQVQCAGP